MHLENAAVDAGDATRERGDDRPALVFDRVGKVFPDGTHAVEEVSIAVRRGEFVSLVGPSGCGKSTLLRIASGLTAPTSGTVTTAHDTLGYVFQDPTLMPWRTVRENVELLGELHHIPRDRRSRLATDAISLVGLDEFVDHYPNALSGGMKMRVSLARALTLSPPLFLFDEPFGALDQITRERLNDETLALFATERFAALFVTHSIFEAVYLSTRVLVMSERPGRIAGAFDVPFTYPRTPELRFDADFADLAGEVSAVLRDGFAGEGERTDETERGGG